MDGRIKDYQPEVSGWVFWPAMIGVIGIFTPLVI